MKILFLSFAVFFLGCHMGVDRAYVPTNPPQAEKSIFKSSFVEGVFVSDSLTTFLWPIDRFDENTKSFVPLSFAEKADSRTAIVRYSEEKAYYESALAAATLALDKKYEALNAELVSDYLAKECYKLCDPFDPLCAQDPDILFQYSWKEAESEEEQATINWCIANEIERKNSEPKKKAEKIETVDPLQEKGNEATGKLAQAVGNRNFITELKGLEFYFGPLKNCVEAVASCLKFKSGSQDILIKVRFEKGSFSNGYDKESIFDVDNVQFDEKGGFLTFDIPALDFENEGREYGQFHFDLELTANDESLDISGDLTLTNFDDGSERIGRFSASGKIQKGE